MDGDRRLREIKLLLESALDNQEEYLYEGEMSSYMRSYAGDAASELQTLFQRLSPSPSEIALCVAALAQPERIANGRSKWLLARLHEQSHPLLSALAKADDPQLRLFAIEAASQPLGQAHLHGYRPRVLCPLIALVPELLDDPNDELRAAAVASSSWMWSNTAFIEQRAQLQSDQIVIRIYHKILSLLDDPAAKVRAASASALGDWAAKLARPALAQRLVHEDDPSVRAALSKALEGKN
jgi:HEAT repeat protein